MPNVLMVTLPTTRHFKEKFFTASARLSKNEAMQKNLKSLARAVLKICSTVCQKL